MTINITESKELNIDDIKIEVVTGVGHWVIATCPLHEAAVYYTPSLLYVLSGHMLGTSPDDQLKTATMKAITKLKYKINRTQTERALSKSLTEKANKIVKEIK